MTRALILLDSTLRDLNIHLSSKRVQCSWLRRRVSRVETAKALLLDTPLLESARANPDVARRCGRSFRSIRDGTLSTRIPRLNLSPRLFSNWNRSVRQRSSSRVDARDGFACHWRPLASAIPNARAIILDGVGHVPNMEDPQTVNEIVFDFLASLHKRRVATEVKANSPMPLPSSALIIGQRVRDDSTLSARDSPPASIARSPRECRCRAARAANWEGALRRGWRERRRCARAWRLRRRSRGWG